MAPLGVRHREITVAGTASVLQVTASLGRRPDCLVVHAGKIPRAAAGEWLLVTTSLACHRTRTAACSSAKTISYLRMRP